MRRHGETLSLFRAVAPESVLMEPRLRCRLGWHAGRWNPPYAVKVTVIEEHPGLSPSTVETREVHRVQERLCPACGAVSRRLVR